MPSMDSPDPGGSGPCRIPGVIARGAAALAIAAVSLAALTFASGARAGTRPAAPDLVVRDLNGATVRLSALKGKVVLVDYWATWCGPCRMEIPHLKKLHAELGPKGLVILGLSVDHQGVEVVRRFVKKNALPWTTALADERALSAFGEVRAIPTAILIDREGRIAGRLVGYQDEARLRAAVKPLL